MGTTRLPVADSETDIIETMTETFKTPNRAPLSDDSMPVSLSHHQRRCAVCKHPDRDAIEEDFLHWRSPYEIANEFDLSSDSPVYRHAHATGFFARRRKNLRYVLERILEHVDEAEKSASAVVRAALAYSRISETGEYVARPSETIVRHIHETAPPRADGYSSSGQRPPENPHRIALLEHGNSPIQIATHEQTE